MRARWRHERESLGLDTAGDDGQILTRKPNLIISTCYQACWEKLFRFFDIEPKVITAGENFTIDPDEVLAAVDEYTMGCVCILGNHYSGHSDPVKEVSERLTQYHKETKRFIPIHVDAASGGFIAPFIEGVPEWDFRLPHVCSVSTSGHKFGESVLGTGWLVARNDPSAADIRTAVSYLGKRSESFTLNFSRPASGVYVQMYKFIRLGKEGYTANAERMLKLASYLREALREMKTKEGKNRFIMYDSPYWTVPVASCRVNHDAIPYEEHELTGLISNESEWFMGANNMTFHHPTKGNVFLPLLKETSMDDSMFRIVVKPNMTMPLCKELIYFVERACRKLDEKYAQGGEEEVLPGVVVEMNTDC